MTLGHEPHPGDPTQTLSFVSQVPSLPRSHWFPLLPKNVAVKAGFPGPPQTSTSTPRSVPPLPSLIRGTPTWKHSSLSTGSDRCPLQQGAPLSPKPGTSDGPASRALGHEGCTGRPQHVATSAGRPRQRHASAREGLALLPQTTRNTSNNIRNVCL